MHGQREKTSLKISYGYWVLVVAFLCVFIKSGCGFFGFSLFIKPLQAHFGWTRAAIMAAFTIVSIIMGLTAPTAGRMVDLYGARLIIIIGTVLAGLGFILLGRMDSLWFFYLSYALIGMGYSAMAEVPATAIVSAWFHKRRGRAIGIMSTGLGAGGLMLAPLIGGYLIPNFGWRVSYSFIGFLTWLLIIPSAFLVLKRTPPNPGHPTVSTESNGADVEHQSSSSNPGGLSLGMAVKTSAFWLIGIAYLLSNISHVGVIQSQVPFLGDLGFPVKTTAFVLSLVGIGSLVGKYGFGWLCDVIQPKHACAIGFGFELISMIILINAKPSTPLFLLWLYGITMGLGTGSWLPTISMLTSTSFGLASYGSIFGFQALFLFFGAAIGPLMAGFLFDKTNTYVWAFAIFISLYAVALPAVLILRRPDWRTQRACSSL